ncbi:MAG: RNA 2',3'-cyclic phosphodiesterase [candidate division WOR-3 bacterium]|nr:RNA 2',3'-cyclic phosphodiesterase [candidate division WOR-3 bacterium]MDW8113867.1 RNA 2',3'-cyclic phosphodiesterase [candidate division WOR-3 bacterium]
MNKIRSFIALEIPEEIKNEIYQYIENFKKDNLPIKWVEKENLHITLVFLGEQDLNFLNKVKEILKKLSSNFKSFYINLANFGFFPNAKKPRVFWIGIKKNKELIVKMAEELNRELKKIGFKPEEREFSPHLTIGRFKAVFNSEKYLSLKYESKDFLIDKITLFKSTLTPQGPIYEVIENYKFSF